MDNNQAPNIGTIEIFEQKQRTNPVFAVFESTYKDEQTMETLQTMRRLGENLLPRDYVHTPVDSILELCIASGKPKA